jgi:hypothetical protein
VVLGVRLSRRAAAWVYFALLLFTWLTLAALIITENWWFGVGVLAQLMIGCVGILDATRGEPYERYRIGRR